MLEVALAADTQCSLRHKNCGPLAANAMCITLIDVFIAMAEESDIGQTRLVNATISEDARTRNGVRG